MIPHQLSIKNFLSYGPETLVIDFSNYHLICLSGKNGHGKSAMLDAITWAIWGQARKSSGNSKPDAGLLHLGQKHMMVILEFEVSGQQYRVRREFLNTASKPFATLDFGIKQPDGTLTALTDKTIKDTQEKIERTIGITYESFTNSTFLRQGQSNEFSKKSPKERKEILAQILQLQKFEDQKKIALLHARKLQLDYTTQNNIIQRIEQELVALANVPQDYATVQENLKQLEQQKTILIQEKAKLLEQRQEIQRKNNEQIFLANQKEEIEKNLRTAEQELSALEAVLKQQKTPIDTAKLSQEEQKLHNLIEQLQQAQQKKLQLKESYLLTKEKLTELINKTQQKFESDQQQLHLEQAKYQQEALHLQKLLTTEKNTRAVIQKNLQDTQHHINKLQQELLQLELIKTQFQETEILFEKNKTTYQNICSQGTYLKQQILHLQQSHQKDLDRCSYCEQSLNEQQHELIAKKTLQEQQQAEINLQQLKDQAQKLKAELSIQNNSLQQLKQQSELFITQSAFLQEQNKQQEKLTHELQTQEQKIACIQKELSVVHEQLQNIQIQLQNLQQNHQKNLQSTDLQELQKSFLTIEQEAKQIIYQPQQHQIAQEKLTEVRTLLAAHAATTDATLQAEQKSQMSLLQKKIKDLQEQHIELVAKLAVYSLLEKEAKELTEQEQDYENRWQHLELQQRSLLVEQGSLQQKQKKRIELESEIANISCNIKTLFQEMTDYQEIAKALGKDGIQALLIEQAIPEIEHETNQILARLTNNQTQIFIESLRDLKKGGSRETLDIKISDSFGLRDYEMFSGGEAFRIDFALRIGISKLLARRAGTTLQTIFIDEGFGSQDEEGLQLIMDNIYKIQDEFAKIIIVSHLPEMKEQFPVQFIIEKKRSGSTISVIHQG